jgi:hypothetical protein
LDSADGSEEEVARLSTDSGVMTFGATKDGCSGDIFPLVGDAFELQDANPPNKMNAGKIVKYFSFMEFLLEYYFCRFSQIVRNLMIYNPARDFLIFLDLIC